MELVNVPEKQNVECAHFSIRGYVVDVRKTNKIACLPFSTELDSLEDLKEQANALPPVHVPKFKWWRCRNCLMMSTNMVGGDVAAEKIGSSLGNAVISSHGDGSRLICGCQEAPEEKMSEGGQDHPEIPVGLNGKKSDLSLCSQKKEDAAPVHPIRSDNHAAMGSSDGSEKNVDQVLNGIVSGPRKVKSSLIVDIGSTESDRSPVCVGKGKQRINSSHGETATAFRSVCREKNAPKESSDVSIHSRNLKCSSGKRPTKIFSKEKPAFAWDSLTKSNEQHQKVMEAIELNGVPATETHKSEDLNVIKARTTKLQFMELDESDDDFPGNPDRDLPNRKDVSGGSVQRRKVRKVRLLTDIMRSEGMNKLSKGCNSDRDAYLDSISTEGARSKADRTSTFNGIDLNADPISNVADQQNNSGIFLSKKRKRRMMSQEEDQGLLLNYPKYTLDKDAISNGDSETENINTRNTGPGTKSYLSKNKNDREINLEKKKQKRTKFEKGQPSSRHVQDSEIHITRREIETESLQERGAHHYAKAKTDNKRITPVKNTRSSENRDSRFSLMNWEGELPEKNQFIRRGMENKHEGSATFPFKYEGLTVGDVQQCLNHMASHRKGNLRKKRNGIRQVDNGGLNPRGTGFDSSLNFQTKPPFGTTNFENSNINRRKLDISSMKTDERAKNASIRAASDDIPMEIIELMAKNQQERRLCSAEGTSGNSYYFSRTGEKVKDADKTDHSRLLFDKNFMLQDSTNERTNISSKGKGVVPAKHKSDGSLFSVDGYKDISFNISQPNQSNGSMDFGAFPQCQDPSRLVQFPYRDSGLNFGKNISWDGIIAHRSSATRFPSEESYPVPAEVPSQSPCREDTQFWSSMGSNYLPFAINGPQKFVGESSHSRMLPKCSEPLPRENLYTDHYFTYMCQNNIARQKQGRDLESNKKRGISRYPFSYGEREDDSRLENMEPSDFYTNQIIPALDLLKLVDSGQNFTKSSTFTTNQQQNNFTSDLFGTSTHVKFGEHFPRILNFDIATCSREKNETLRRITKSSAQGFDEIVAYPPKPQEQEKRKRKQPITQPRDPIPKSSGQTKATRGPITRVDSDVAILPVSTSFSTEICSINRNPADFCSPGPTNIYMIGSADLKRKRTNSTREKSSPNNQDTDKQRGIMKVTPTRRH